MKDFYYILGTPRDAAAPEIEAAYKKLASKFAGEQDEFMDAHFREIAEAYDTLRDAPRRRKYDAALRHSQKKQVAAFKLKYLNIAATLTLLVVTALFAGYVIRSLNGHPANKIVPKLAIQPAAPAAHIKKHHRTVVPHEKTAPPLAPAASSQATRRVVRPDSATLHANITGIVYLHQSPDYGSPVLAKLPDAATVRVLQKGSAYWKVSYEGKTGYVLSSTIEH